MTALVVVEGVVIAVLALLVVGLLRSHAEILRRLRRRYEALHMHILVADGRAVEFFEKCGFARAGETQAMWIYAGGEH